MTAAHAEPLADTCVDRSVDRFDDARVDVSADAAFAEWEWELLLSDRPSLLSADPQELTVSGRLGLLAELQRERSRLAALEALVLVAIAGPEPSVRRVEVDARTVEVADEACELVAATLHRSPLTVRGQVADARRLVRELERTHALLAEGVLTPEQAAQVVRHAPAQPGPWVQDFEERLLARAPRLTPGETGSLARRIRARVDAAGEEARRQAARRFIDVRIWAEDDGLAIIRRAVITAPEFMKPEGRIIFEIGATQGDAVKGLMSATGSYADISIIQDYNRRDRFVAGRRSTVHS